MRNTKTARHSICLVEIGFRFGNRIGLLPPTLFSACFRGFPLLLFTGFFVGTPPLDLLNDSSFLTFLLEPLQSLLERFIFQNLYFRHTIHPPPFSDTLAELLDFRSSRGPVHLAATEEMEVEVGN